MAKENEEFRQVLWTGGGSIMLKLFTTYCPPEHAPGTEHKTKGEADAEPPEKKRAMLKELRLAHVKL